MIDKIIPRYLDSDTDERLVEEGVMTDALNVIMSVTLDGTGSVLQNAVSTQAIEADGDGVSANAVVIGSVSDSQRDRVYFFVHDTADANGDGIYMYTPSNNTYKRVFTSSWFDFDASYTVKADVVNGAFQQDGVLQTIVYFTDGNNQPRKINIDRAILGEYEGYSDSKLDYALNSIKAAPISPPNFYFESDLSVETNNFTSNTFQYAIQYVYKDGEVSAVSPHSVLAFPRWASVQGVEELGFGRQAFNDNVCAITFDWSSDVNSPANIPEVKKVRLLAKSSYEGSFFIVDEFNPNESLSREIYGVTKVIYDNQAGVYRFYNEGAYSSIPAQESLKLYDNVPFSAVGQSVTGNRLMYSNYTEGRQNHPVSASITPVYSQSIDGISSEELGGLDFEYDPSSAVHSLGKIAIDVNTIFDTDTIPAGTTTTISFKYDPSGSFANDDAGEYAITVDAIDSNQDSFQIGFGNEGATHSGGVILKKVLDDKEVTIVIKNESEITRNDFAQLLNQKFENIFWSKTYSVSNSELIGEVINSNSSIYSNGSLFTFDNGLDLEVTTVFSLNSSVVLSSTNTVLVTPQVYFSSINGHENSTGASGDYVIGAQSFQGGLTYYINNSSSPSLNSGESWHDTYNSSDAFYLEDESAFTDARFSTNTFKSNCTHELGVVYYDKYGRCGNVNKIGAFYAAPFGDTSRSGKEGACSVSINFSDNAPDWAERYQIVYPGMSSYSSVLQYTSGGAFYNTETNDKRIYLSLKTLSNYQDQKSSLRNYSFTEGDKLRVISYDSATGTDLVAENIQYPRANDGTIIEFNIVDVIQNPTELDGITFNNQHQSSSLSEYTGEFLVLEAPSVSAGVQVIPTSGGAATNLKYQGFDYFSISGTTYPGESTTPTKKNYWGQRSVFEILSPRKTASERVYYEVGSSRKVGLYKSGGSSNHGPAFVLSAGDLHLNPISCLTPIRDDHSNEHTDGSAANWNQMSVGHWEYRLNYLESHSVSDFFLSDRWDRGRTHVVYEDAATINRFNGVTWSDPYEEDVSVLSLSSFTPSTANFFSFDSKYGAVNYIDNLNSDLVALQENKMAIAAVNKEFLNYADGSSSVTVSNTVIGSPQYSSGDFGMGSDVSSVLLRDGQVFFADRSRRRIMRYSGGQLTPISDKGMSAWFDSKISGMSSAKIVSGYDPDSDMYYVTLYDETAGYNVTLGKWQSKYSFTPDCYSLINSKMLSFKPANILGTDYIIHSHDGNTRLNFYGASSSAEVTVVSKRSPDSVKTFNALSTHSDSAWGARITSDLGQDTGADNMLYTTFQEKEGAYYRDIPGNNTFSYLILGEVVSVSGSVLTLSRKLVGLPIPTGGVLTASSDQGESWFGTGAIVGVYANERKIQVASNAGAFNGYLVAVKALKSGIDGDRIRGHYAKITLTNNSSTKEELFSISTHISNSPLNHALGQ